MNEFEYWIVSINFYVMLEQCKNPIFFNLGNLRTLWGLNKAPRGHLLAKGGSGWSHQNRWFSEKFRNLQNKFFDWKWPPPPIFELFRKFISATYDILYDYKPDSNFSDVECLNFVCKKNAPNEWIWSSNRASWWKPNWLDLVEIVRGWLWLKAG